MGHCFTFNCPGNRGYDLKNAQSSNLGTYASQSNPHQAPIIEGYPTKQLQFSHILGYAQNPLRKNYNFDNSQTTAMETNAQWNSKWQTIRNIQKIQHGLNWTIHEASQSYGMATSSPVAQKQSLLKPVARVSSAFIKVDSSNHSLKVNEATNSSDRPALVRKGFCLMCEEDVGNINGHWAKNSLLGIIGTSRDNMNGETSSYCDQGLHSEGNLINQNMQNDESSDLLTRGFCLMCETDVDRSLDNGHFYLETLATTKS
ncbi:Hypothetical predicted protein [Cloeon dipterum]|uniref:Uncharacterized protein n=1 Tax=Cloeon dipterum TaxID=197152 RepID=A0A8S1D873_9INSE|nr:Hypothetical predicted protein [Cloeon dipterum]